jgi:type II secretory ATPase GspE/PulE/Tfp pilus assembly ATPase PilB-like protein
MAEIGFPVEWTENVRRPVGCERCRQSGYSGRTALFEIVLMSSRLQEAIQRRGSGPELRELAMREGMIPLRKDGWLKVRDGVTSIEEVLRVTSSELEALDE